jgi:hypothetical protein
METRSAKALEKCELPAYIANIFEHLNQPQGNLELPKFKTGAEK